jgi:hypothetical protein
MDLKEMEECGLNLCGLGDGRMAGCFECGDEHEPSGSLKGEEFLE